MLHVFGCDLTRHDKVPTIHNVHVARVALSVRTSDVSKYNSRLIGFHRSNNSWSDEYVGNPSALISYPTTCTVVALQDAAEKIRALKFTFNKLHQLAMSKTPHVSRVEATLCSAQVICTTQSCRPHTRF